MLSIPLISTIYYKNKTTSVRPLPLLLASIASRLVCMHDNLLTFTCMPLQRSFVLSNSVLVRLVGDVLVIGCYHGLGTPCRGYNL